MQRKTIDDLFKQLKERDETTSMKEKVLLILRLKIEV
jgi:hypothetical protein